MKSSKTYFITGLFSLAVISVTLAVMVYLTGSPSASDAYYSRFQSVAGLDYGKPVYFQGYRIGQVSSVRPLEGVAPVRFRVDYQITEGWKIPVDSTAVVQSTGLLGDVSINIEAGTSGEFLTPGSEIPGQEALDLMGTVAGLAQDFERLNREKVIPLLDLLYARADELTHTLSKKIPMLLENVDQVTGQVNQLLEASGDVLNQENAQHIRLLLENSRKFSEQLNKVGDEAHQLLTQAGSVIEKNDPRLEAMMVQLAETVGVLSTRLDTISNELESASMNLNELTDELRRNPSRLLFKPKSVHQDDAP